MIDLHCHLLPGVDDGARTMEDALTLAEAAVANGVKASVLTPHVYPGVFDNRLSTLRPVYEEYRDALARAGIALDVHLGGEVHLHPDAFELLEADDLPMTVQQTISRVIAEGVDNVIHHAPARCRCVVRVLLSEVCATVHVLSPVPSGFTMPSLGWGLRGLQERIHLTGGCFEATVTDEQWSLRAVLPLE